MANSSNTNVVLYTSGTPNGQKASITLEELGIHYEVKNIEISKNVQKEDWFLKINPNGRIPAIVDRTPTSEGKARDKRIFESGALMLYLCQRYDPENKLNYPYDSDEYWEVVEWLVWMQSGLGPMQVCQCSKHCVVPMVILILPNNRDKQITSIATLQKRSNTASSATKPRRNVFTKSLKIGLLSRPKRLREMAHGLSETE